MLGGFLAYFLLYAKADIGICDKKFTGNAMTREIFGCMVYVFLFMSQTDTTFKTSKNEAVITATLAAAYCFSIVLGFSDDSNGMYSLSPLNPTIACSQIVMMMLNGDYDKTDYHWIFIVCPWIGGLIAVFLYECIFRKAEVAFVEQGLDMQRELANQNEGEVALLMAQD